MKVLVKEFAEKKIEGAIDDILSYSKSTSNWNDMKYFENASTDKGAFTKDDLAFLWKNKDNVVTTIEYKNGKDIKNTFIYKNRTFMV